MDFFRVNESLRLRGINQSEIELSSKEALD
jgi:hypothetical protein